MFSSENIEIVIGLIFIYLILSLLNTTINELIAGLIRLRGRDLRRSLQYMLSEGDDLKDKSLETYKSFVKHPLFTKLKRNTNRKFPSYLSSSTFSRVLFDTITVENTHTTKKEIDTAIDEMKGPLGKVVKLYWEEAGKDAEKFKKKLDEWFDEMQTRVTGWYKRRVQWILLIIGFVIAFAVNADTFSIVEKLSGDSKARKALVELAMKQSQQIGTDYFPDNEPSLESDVEEVDEQLVYESEEIKGSSYDDIKKLSDQTQEIINDQLSEVNFIMGMGWNSMIKSHCATKTSDRSMLWWYFKKFFGLMLTAIALSLGANFWFDLLQKAIALKNSGGVPVKQEPKEQDSNKPLKP